MMSGQFGAVGLSPAPSDGRLGSWEERDLFLLLPSMPCPSKSYKIA